MTKTIRTIRHVTVLSSPMNFLLFDLFTSTKVHLDIINLVLHTIDSNIGEKALLVQVPPEIIQYQHLSNKNRD